MRKGSMNNAVPEIALERGGILAFRAYRAILAEDWSWPHHTAANEESGVSIMPYSKLGSVFDEQGIETGLTSFAPFGYTRYDQTAHNQLELSGCS